MHQDAIMEGFQIFLDSDYIRFLCIQCYIVLLNVIQSLSVIFNQLVVSLDNTIFCYNCIIRISVKQIELFFLALHQMELLLTFEKLLLSMIYSTKSGLHLQS